MRVIHLGSQTQPAINWSRRRFLIGSTAAGITLALVPLMATHQWQGRKLLTLVRYGVGVLIASAIIWAPWPPMARGQ